MKCVKRKVSLKGYFHASYQKMDSADLSSKNYTTTPLKSEGYINASARRQNCVRNINSDRTISSTDKISLRCDESTVKKPGIKPKSRSSFKSSLIKKMPIYSPSPDTIRHVKNPFEHACFLTERLRQPICSPSLFEKVESPKEEEQFNWTIEDISVLRPAPINENPSQEFNSWFSPTTENEAQKAINQFFSSQTVNMESPSEIRSRFSVEISRKNKPVTTETWSQTILSFPPSLPPEIEKLLSNYCSFNENQNGQDNEDYDVTKCSVSWKKLLFDSSREDVESTCNTPLQLNKKCNKHTLASTPIRTVLTSPELSPIAGDIHNNSVVDVSMSYKSRTKLNLINDVEMQEKENMEAMSWNQDDAIINSEKSLDSAFSSV